MFDADLREYFETIAHKPLLERVALRVSDRHILRWIKEWLKAPVVEEGEGGKRRTSGGKRTRRGTPQGGVLLPLLANIYLHLFDKTFRAYCRGTGLAAQLIRYADDFVILMRGRVEPTLEQIKGILDRMELTLNQEKSRVVDAREEGFDFLGFTFKRKQSRASGKVISLVEPSRKSEQHFRDEVRQLTARTTHCLPQEQVLERLNRYVRGWVNYFHVYNSTQVFKRQRYFLEQRTRKYLQKRRQRAGFGYERWPTAKLYGEIGLYAIPVYASYRRNSHALG